MEVLKVSPAKLRMIQGYGKDAKMQLLAYAFLDLNLRKICSSAKAFNTRGINYKNATWIMWHNKEKRQFWAETGKPDGVLVGRFEEHLRAVVLVGLAREGLLCQEFPDAGKNTQIALGESCALLGEILAKTLSGCEDLIHLLSDCDRVTYHTEPPFRFTDIVTYTLKKSNKNPRGISQTERSRNTSCGYKVEGIRKKQFFVNGEYR